MRVNRPLVGSGYRKYAGMNLGSEGLKEAHKASLVTFPSVDKYLPWETYHDEFQEKVFTLYHPYQLLEVANFLKWQGIKISPQYIEDPKNVEVVFQQLKKWNESIVSALLKSRLGLVSLEGFLMLLEHEFASGSQRKQIIELVKETEEIDVLKSWYENLALEGNSRDSLSRWFPLTRLVRNSMRKQLRREALLADDYYDMAEMVGYAIEDATGEKMPDPDEFAYRNTSWKKVTFGENFDYNSRETRTRILDYYLKDRQILNLLIFEGDTEEVAVEGLLQALHVDEQTGLELVNLRGFGNLGSKEVRRKLMDMRRLHGNVSVMVDREPNIEYELGQYVADGLAPEGGYKIWKGDFEQDNFGTEPVLHELNRKLQSQGLDEVTRPEVEEWIDRDQNLMSVLETMLNRKYRVDLETILPKKILAATMLGPRFNEVEEESLGAGWNPKLPYEQFLQQSLLNRIRIYR